MRLISLNRLLKISLLTSRTLKNIKLALNIGIFISIFAITATLISIYYETKINNTEKKIFNNKLLIDITSLSISVIPENISNLDMVLDEDKKHHDLMTLIFFSKMGGLISNRELHYLPSFKYVPHLDKGYSSIPIFADVNKFKDDFVESKDLKELNELMVVILKDKEKFLNIRKSIETKHEKLTDVQGGMKTIVDEDFYKTYENYHDEFKKFSKNQIKTYTILNTVLRAFTDKKKNENIKLRKQISDFSLSASRFIIIAFLIQLIMFALIQFLEIYTTNREFNEKR